MRYIIVLVVLIFAGVAYAGSITTGGTGSITTGGTGLITAAIVQELTFGAESLTFGVEPLIF